MVHNRMVTGLNDEILIDLIKFDSDSIYQALYIAGQHSISQIDLKSH